ncbi:hypothetical protein ACI2K4_35295 [Micromonospora sp. NPDC050397]|uniref:hypothetical protein n=1 Tax=Micromonospora sp. NPDC050397 TaxID=3364279 RepID=UPI00384AAEEF
MPLRRVVLDSDRATARRVLELHRAGKIHRESRDAARDEIWRRGHTPAGEPVFVGLTNGHPVRLVYDVEVYPDATP